MSLFDEFVRSYVYINTQMRPENASITNHTNHDRVATSAAITNKTVFTNRTYKCDWDKIGADARSRVTCGIDNAKKIIPIKNGTRPCSITRIYRLAPSCVGVDDWSESRRSCSYTDNGASSVGSVASKSTM